MKVLVGLGNPGDEYRHTRHNVGFAVMDALAAEGGGEGEARAGRGGKVSRRQCRCRVGEIILGGMEVVLAKPQTFMNNSGRAVGALLERWEAQLEDLLVVCDDFHLDLGMLRVRRRGSSGGQKGLQSIIDSLGSTEFARLRVGIGPPRGDPVDFVLEPFRKVERPLVREAVSNARRACAVWVAEGVDACMSAFN